ncbi:ribonucleoside-diphosphate reductase subunit alpha, partial [Bacillus atrophaeus]|nr:ribonucleoside-diphosphate reductase subunit alpha [Bacillus atrophaeus]
KANARKLLEKLAILRSESGYPYLMFADNVNSVHVNNHISLVKFSNLCSEVLESSEVSTYTDYGEEDKIGLDISCNLGS